MTTEIELKGRPAVALPAAISTAIVRLMRDYTGRGPMKARTTIRDNVVLVMLEQTLTKGEQVLVEKGRTENVLALRREYQEAMREESSQKIAELTGRVVIAMISANHVAPDLPPRSTCSTDPPISTHAPPIRARPSSIATLVSPRYPANLTPSVGAEGNGSTSMGGPSDSRERPTRSAT